MPLEDSKILITGGSGFLGRAILRKAERENWNSRFTVYSRDETKQWELKHRYPKTICVLGDVARDLDRLMAVMSGHDYVIHAGAIKYIPEAEWNVFEAMTVNVIGSQNVAIAARAAGVKTVVGISTDKACGPLNTYGMTKALMERMFAEADRNSSTNLTTVRYGNVVGSTGSVIPIFKQQIQDEGFIKVTDSSMTRFWLSVEEAIDLIAYAAFNASVLGGSTVIPACPAMKIVDIAKAVWQMERGQTEPKIVYTGIRPGEKFHEALFNEQEAPRIEMLDTKYWALRPATSKGINGPPRMDYTSNQPARWMSISEMIEAIKDAQSV